MSHDLQFSIEGETPAQAAGYSDPGFATGFNNNAVQQQQQQQQPNNSLPKMMRISQSSHPSACMFHFIFKLASMFLYVFGGWFSHNSKDGVSGANFITVTVFCILLLAADFWVVKNITGRLLVGLRWWNKVEGENTTWIFESAETKNVNKFDNSVFWGVLYVTPVIWGAFFLLGLLKFQFSWLLTTIMGISLSGANVYGYYKCSSDQKEKLKQMMQQGAQQGAMAMIRHNVFGMLTGTAVGNGGGTTTPATAVV